MPKVREIKTCPQCNQEFTHPDKRQKYCCMDCRAKAYAGDSNPNSKITKSTPKPPRLPDSLDCLYCGLSFSPVKPDQQFCSLKCKYDGLRTGTINRNGYRLITIEGKHVLEHRHVMSQHLSRRLTDKESVHHIDGDKLNNDISNLKLFDNHALHLKEERTTLFRSDTHKECFGCREVKPRSEFTRFAVSAMTPYRDPHMSRCKKCSAAVNMAKRKGQYTPRKYNRS